MTISRNDSNVRQEPKPFYSLHLSISKWRRPDLALRTPCWRLMQAATSRRRCWAIRSSSRAAVPPAWINRRRCRRPFYRPGAPKLLGGRSVYSLLQ